jgi:hypothetical protein
VLSADQARDLLEIAEDRCDRGSISRWHDLIGVTPT